MAFTEIFEDFRLNLELVTGFGVETDGCYYIHFGMGSKVVVRKKDWVKVTRLLTKTLCHKQIEAPADVIKLYANTECEGCVVRTYCNEKRYGSGECRDLRNVITECIRCADWADCKLADKSVTYCMHFKSIPKT